MLYAMDAAQSRLPFRQSFMNTPSCVAYHHPRLPIDLLEVNRRLRQPGLPKCLSSSGPQARSKSPDSASTGTPAPYNVKDPCSELRWRVRLVEDEVKHFEDNMQDTHDYWQSRLELTSNIHQLMQAHRRKFQTDGRIHEMAENRLGIKLGEHSSQTGDRGRLHRMKDSIARMGQLGRPRLRKRRTACDKSPNAVRQPNHTATSSGLQSRKRGRNEEDTDDSYDEVRSSKHPRRRMTPQGHLILARSSGLPRAIVT